MGYDPNSEMNDARSIAESMIGRKIVEAEVVQSNDPHILPTPGAVVLHLDDGRAIQIEGWGDGYEVDGAGVTVAVLKTASR